jgi:hypothetical protein
MMKSEALGLRLSAIELTVIHPTLLVHDLLRSGEKHRDESNAGTKKKGKQGVGCPFVSLLNHAS